MDDKLKISKSTSIQDVMGVNNYPSSVDQNGQKTMNYEGTESSLPADGMLQKPVKMKKESGNG